MKRSLVSAAAILWLAVLLVLGCSPDSTAPALNAPPVSFIEHIDLGCIADKDEPVWESYLVGYSVSGDTLTLTAHFWLQCMPEFDQNVVVDGANITIAVHDTAAWGADCLCNFENKFRFHWDGTRELSLSFEAYEGLSPTPRCGFDTLFVVTSGDGDRE